MKRYLNAAFVLCGAIACSNQRDANDPDRLEPASGTTVAVEDRNATEIGPDPSYGTERDDATRVSAPDAPAPSAGTEARSDATKAPALTPSDARAPDASDGRTAPDNTDKNERDRGDKTLTPLDQKNSEGDLKITQKIRQAVMGDSSLSFTAKNVKIITIDGNVTLRGPVNTAEERQAIEAAARKVAGAGRVDNQLEVKK
jgi:hyperosmotically inducible periplasmic protein